MCGCLESQPTSGAFACPVYRGWVGKSELFNFKCCNKANVVETKMSIEDTNLKAWARTVGPPASGPPGSGVKDTV